jgi:hypothetical protein
MMLGNVLFHRNHRRTLLNDLIVKRNYGPEGVTGQSLR